MTIQHKILYKLVTFLIITNVYLLINTLLQKCFLNYNQLLI